ncbi:MAG: FG-GAP repeat protein, partial [Actinomycetota bacterium]|nr:FG-GAP repeat protein [Actinomycetota bacterium]
MRGPRVFDLARRLAFALPLALVLWSAAPAAALEQKLIAADGIAEARLGRSVAIEGDTAVVGAPFANGKGAVYVFARSGDAWTQTAKLTASDGAAGDRLGDSVAIEGDTIVAGAPNDDITQGGKPFPFPVVKEDQGSVYAFARTGAAARTETAKLTATDGAAGDVLGFSVAIDGDTIVAGARDDDVGTNAGQGSAYAFSRTGTAARTETAKLTATDGAERDRLGFSVAIEGDTIVAGAPGEDLGTKEGSAYTFGRTGAAARTETARLTATDGAERDKLGFSVAIEGDTIIAGAPGDDVDTKASQGSAYTFGRTGAAARTETARLT